MSESKKLVDMNAELVKALFTSLELGDEVSNAFKNTKGSVLRQLFMLPAEECRVELNNRKLSPFLQEQVIDHLMPYVLEDKEFSPVISCGSIGEAEPKKRLTHSYDEYDNNDDEENDGEEDYNSRNYNSRKRM